MRTLVISVNGDLVAIRNQQGDSIYVCDKDGTRGQAATLLSILRATVSAKGMVVAFQEDSKASYIYLYKRGGSPLDIIVKPLLSGDGYPMDLSLPSNGTQLITSYIYLDQGVIKCKIMSYNFELGKSDPNRVAGIFFPKGLGDATAGEVRFLDESHSVVFTDKGIQFLSTRVEASPELVNQTPIEENIGSITYAQDEVGIVIGNVEDGDLYKLRIYDREGSPVFEKTFNYQCTGFDIGSDLALLHNDSSCKVYNVAGAEKYNGTSNFTVNRVSAGRFPGALLIIGPQKMTEIKL